MDDLERYGDYNEVDEAPTSSPVLRIIKATALVICFAIIGLIGFRVFTFNYYPASVKTLTFTEGLTEYYNASSGDITVYTQDLQSPYDDPSEGNIFCDHLRVVREAGYLQVTLRFNTSFEKTLAETYSAQIDLDDSAVFDFRLARSGDSNGTPTGRLVSIAWEKFLMYRYATLVFEDVDFGEGDTAANWLRLETRIKGATYLDKADKTRKEKVFLNLIYEDHDTYSKFTEYKLSDGEAPQ
ncbi:MAG: hypothetical protein IJ459_00815 [Clostridia bacterium]|nr:hypothetical protein [Clostridia bacterium]